MEELVAYAGIGMGTKILVDYGRDESLRGLVVQSLSRKPTNVSEYSVGVGKQFFVFKSPSSCPDSVLFVAAHHPYTKGEARCLLHRIEDAAISTLSETFCGPDSTLEEQPSEDALAKLRELLTSLLSLVKGVVDREPTAPLVVYADGPAAYATYNEALNGDESPATGWLPGTHHLEDDEDEDSGDEEAVKSKKKRDRERRKLEREMHEKWLRTRKEGRRQARGDASPDNRVGSSSPDVDSVKKENYSRLMMKTKTPPSHLLEATSGGSSPVVSRTEAEEVKNAARSSEQADGDGAVRNNDNQAPPNRCPVARTLTPRQQLMAEVVEMMHDVDKKEWMRSPSLGSLSGRSEDPLSTTNIVSSWDRPPLPPSVPLTRFGPAASPDTSSECPVSVSGKREMVRGGSDKGMTSESKAVSEKVHIEKQKTWSDFEGHSWADEARPVKGKEHIAIAASPPAVAAACPSPSSSVGEFENQITHRGRNLWGGVGYSADVETSSLAESEQCTASVCSSESGSCVSKCSECQRAENSRRSRHKGISFRLFSRKNKQGQQSPISSEREKPSETGLDVENSTPKQETHLHLSSPFASKVGSKSLLSRLFGRKLRGGDLRGQGGDQGEDDEESDGDKASQRLRRMSLQHSRQEVEEEHHGGRRRLSVAFGEIDRIKHGAAARKVGTSNGKTLQKNPCHVDIGEGEGEKGPAGSSQAKLFKEWEEESKSDMSVWPKDSQQPLHA